MNGERNSVADEPSTLSRISWLQTVVLRAYSDTPSDPALGFEGTGETRWFPRKAAGQTNATIFAWRCVVGAAQRLIEVGGLNGQSLEFCTTYGRDVEGKKEQLEGIVQQGLTGVEICSTSVLVDFALFGKCLPVQTDDTETDRKRIPRGKVYLTAESEMHIEHFATWRGDYAWDFYKLLVVPSPLRLFFCRVVAGQGKRRRTCRVERLKKTLGEMVEEYRRLEYLQDRDEVGIVILSEAGWVDGENQSCVTVASGATAWRCDWRPLWAPRSVE